MTLDLDGNATAGDERYLHLERFMHAEIYRMRPDVHAIVHSHTVHRALRCRSRRQVAAHLPNGRYAWTRCADLRDQRCAGPATDMLVRDARLARALVNSLARASVVLMRGHGITVVGSSLRETVFRAVYADLNAQLQADD